jgi:hypothetical protein
VAYDRAGNSTKVMQGFTGQALASSVLRTSAF